MTTDQHFPAGRGQDEPRNQPRDRSGQSVFGTGSSAQHAVDSAALSAAMDRADAAKMAEAIVFGHSTLPKGLR